VKALSHLNVVGTDDGTATKVALDAVGVKAVPTSCNAPYCGATKGRSHEAFILPRIRK
jgi:hypothetical protein